MQLSVILNSLSKAEVVNSERFVSEQLPSASSHVKCHTATHSREIQKPVGPVEQRGFDIVTK